jgi:omega-6 fatty acid desaturase (delta-12 desaturase)
MSVAIPQNNQAIYDQIKIELKDWHKIIKEYQIPSTKKALFHTILTWAMYLSVWALQFWLMYNGYSVWWVVLIGIWNGLALGRIFIIQHDCGHKSFTAKQWLNDTIGTICSFMTIIPYKYWAKSHDFHHAHNGQLETSDIGDFECLTTEQYAALNWKKKIRYRVYRNPLYILTLGGPMYVTIFNRFRFLKSEYFAKVKNNVTINNILFLATYLLLGWLLGWKNFFVVQFINICFFGILALWFFYVQHQYSEVYKEGQENWNYLLSAIRGSTFYKLPRFMHFMTGNIGYHHIHHLSPTIPFYNLRKCSIENPIFQKYCVPLTIAGSVKTFFANLWDDETKKMISFKEFKRRKQAKDLAAK